MGKTNNFISGGFSGRLGNVVGYQWRGREVHLWGFVRDRAGRALLCQYIGCGVLDAAVQSFVSQDEEDGDEIDFNAGEQPSYQLFTSDGVCKEPSLSDASDASDGGRSAPM